MDDKLRYTVHESKRETYDTVTLKLVASEGNLPSFTAGQFISVYIPELGTPEGKSYSISNAPGTGTLDITVKGIGEFSNRLCACTAGDTITGSLPYGFFFSEQEDTDLVMIGSGIGVTPFHSSILDAREKNSKRHLTLYHTARTVADLTFREEFQSLPGLTLRYFVTRQKNPEVEATTRRMRAEDVLESSHTATSEFFLCGSIPFVRDMWHGLKIGGIPEERIYTEAFFSH